ncbi:MAG TPA: hypothetical protein VFQ39_12495, partial [Longimicrobium sp.]|nr:hypothetical protein [Longimicrobium sp.]
MTPATGVSHYAAGGRGVQVFTVENTGDSARAFTVTALCAGGATCSPSVARMVLDAHASGMAGINYVAPSGEPGIPVPAVRLVATLEGNAAVADTGMVTLAPASLEVLVDEGDRGRLDRGACVSASAGAGAVFECGDLRLAHGLPATRSRNRARAPVLLYNSQHARPYPIVSLDVAPPEGTSPDTIRAVLQLADTTVTAWWPGWANPNALNGLPNDPALRRISVGFDAGDRAGVYDYVLTLTARWNGGASEEMGSYGGRIVIVNRKGSEFGAGWWLAGLERIWARNDGSLLWVGGDGSHHLYFPDPASATRWGADPFTHPDSIVLRSNADPTLTRYVRILPGRAEVRFDSYGRHRETVSVTGDTTWFTYDSEGRLDLVTWSGAGGNGYDFRYSASGAPLSSVGTWGAATGTERVVAVATDANRRVTAIVDPAQDTVRFGYAAGSTSAVVTSRTDREGHATNFIFDAGNKLWRSTFALKATATSPDDSINIRFSPVETRGLGPFPVTLDGAHVGVNGPRTEVNDIHYIYVNRHGAPVRIVDPGFGNTYVTYGDPRWPGLPTRVVHPDGREIAATYDARGHLESTTDLSTQSADGRFATTLYRWDPYWDRVVGVTAPEGETTLTGLDAKGRVAWVQPGPSATRRTNVAYLPDNHASAPGLVSTVTAPGSDPESYQYDARG